MEAHQSRDRLPLCEGGKFTKEITIPSRNKKGLTLEPLHFYRPSCERGFSAFSSFVALYTARDRDAGVCKNHFSSSKGAKIKRGNVSILFAKASACNQERKTHLCRCFLCSAGTIDFISPLNSDSVCSETSYMNPES